MTLINFLTRVHFADGILEEALHSEIEANNKRRPLVVAADDRMSNLGADRFYSGFPMRAEPVVFSDVPHLPTESAARAVAKLYRDSDCDVLVAFGSNRVIDLAKAARIAIAHAEPLDMLSIDEGGSRRINGHLPHLYAVPDILGFASAISDYARLTLDDKRHILFSSRNLVPCITICDPTLTLGAMAEDSANAAAGVMSRAIDSYLSPRYHPPADGLALDALNRIWINIGPALNDDDLPARRELLAAGLNSSLSLQKGLCVIHALCNAITAASDSKPDPSAVGGVVISHLVEFYEQSANGLCDPIKRALRIDERRALADGLRDMLSEWPIPRKLSELGIEVSALGKAATIAACDRAITGDPRNFERSEIRELLARAH